MPTSKFGCITRVFGTVQEATSGLVRTRDKAVPFLGTTADTRSVVVVGPRDTPAMYLQEISITTNPDGAGSDVNIRWVSSEKLTKAAATWYYQGAELPEEEIFQLSKDKLDEVLLHSTAKVAGLQLSAQKAHALACATSFASFQLNDAVAWMPGVPSSNLQEWGPKLVAFMAAGSGPWNTKAYWAFKDLVFKAFGGNPLKVFRQYACRGDIFYRDLCDAAASEIINLQNALMKEPHKWLSDKRAEAWLTKEYVKSFKQTWPHWMLSEVGSTDGFILARRADSVHLETSAWTANAALGIEPTTAKSVRITKQLSPENCLVEIKPTGDSSEPSVETVEEPVLKGGLTPA
jgi:hypothetical protein